jgi:hypothetical protein
MIAVLVLLLAFGAAGCGDSDSPSGVVEAFVEASIDNDCDAVVDMIYFGEDVDSVIKDGFKQACNESGLTPEGSELVSVEVSDEEIDGDHATVMAKITTSMAGEELVDDSEVELFNDDGEWKVDVSSLFDQPVE